MFNWFNSKKETPFTYSYFEDELFLIYKESSVLLPETVSRDKKTNYSLGKREINQQFINTPNAKVYENVNDEIESNIEINNTNKMYILALEYFTKKYGNKHNIISYEHIHNLLSKKYVSLGFDSVKFYENELPVSNLGEIEIFSSRIDEKDFCYYEEAENQTHKHKEYNTLSYDNYVKLKNSSKVYLGLRNGYMNNHYDTSIKCLSDKYIITNDSNFKKYLRNHFYDSNFVKPIHVEYPSIQYNLLHNSNIVLQPVNFTHENETNTYFLVVTTW